MMICQTPCLASNATASSLTAWGRRASRTPWSREGTRSSRCCRRRSTSPIRCSTTRHGEATGLEGRDDRGPGRKRGRLHLCLVVARRVCVRVVAEHVGGDARVSGCCADGQTQQPAQQQHPAEATADRLRTPSNQAHAHPPHTRRNCFSRSAGRRRSARTLSMHTHKCSVSLTRTEKWPISAIIRA